MRFLLLRPSELLLGLVICMKNLRPPLHAQGDLVHHRSHILLRNINDKANSKAWIRARAKLLTLVGAIFVTMLVLQIKIAERPYRE